MDPPTIITIKDGIQRSQREGGFQIYLPNFLLVYFFPNIGTDLLKS